MSGSEELCHVSEELCHVPYCPIVDTDAVQVANTFISLWNIMLSHSLLLIHGLCGDMLCIVMHWLSLFLEDVQMASEPHCVWYAVLHAGR